MSDEEKKAIEYLKRHIIPCYGRKGTIEFMLNDIVLNLIEKQQKEIEELKEKNRQSKMRIVQLENEITARIEDVNKYFTPNDKIKAKIEEYKKQQKEEPDSYLCIKVLSSLLEKE